jgi:hypothetical protein
MARRKTSKQSLTKRSKTKTRASHKHEAEEAPEKVKVKGKKLVVILVILIIIGFIFAQVLDLYVLPRVTIDLKTTYHEATGGVGTGGQMNGNTKIINSVTMDISDIIVRLSLLDSTKTLLTNETYVEGVLSPGASHELKLLTNGNCFKKFYIELEVEFETGNEQYYERYVYSTHEDAMNIGFENSIFDWGF